jgi:hypothetical protein
VYFEFVRDTLESLRTAGKLRDINATVATFGLFGTLLWLPRWFHTDGRLTSETVIDQIVDIASHGLLKHACAEPQA